MAKRKLKFCLAFIPSVFLLMTLYFEFRSTPTFIKDFLRSEFSKNGYNLEFEDSYIRFWGKSEINKFSINNKTIKLTGETLKISFSLLNLFSSQSIIKNFYGNKIDAKIHTDQKNIPIISNGSFNGRVVNNLIFIDKLRFFNFNTLFEISGVFPLATTQTTPKEYNNDFVEGWKFITNKIHYIQSKIDFKDNLINYKLNFNFSKALPIIKSKIDIPSFFHNGNCQNIKLHFSFFPNEKIVDINKLLVQLNEYEKIEGTTFLNLKKNLISSDLLITAIPQNLLQIISPNLEKEISPYLPKFNTIPPLIRLNIRNEPLDEPLKWNLNGKVYTKDIHINDLKISSGTCNLKINIEEKTIILDQVNLIANKLKGLFNILLDFKEKTIFLSAKGKGNPRLFQNFIWDNPIVKERLVSIWKDFKWSINNQNLPEFEFKLINTFNNPNWAKEPTSKIINGKSSKEEDLQYKTFLEGKIKINKFKYKNQYIKSISSDVFLKLPEYIMLRDIKIDSGNGFVTNGTYIYNDKFHLVGFKSLTPLSFLNNLSPYPVTLPPIISYDSNPKIEFFGVFFNEENSRQESFIDAVGIFPKLKFLKTPTTNNVNQFSMRGEFIRINSLGNIHQGTYSSNYEQKLQEETASLQIEINNISFGETVKDYKKDSPFTKSSGKTTGNFDLNLDYAVAEGQPINISGEGQLSITEGAFARIPLLSIIDIKSLTKITAINVPKMLFEGQHIYFPKENPITTDGVIFSIASNGKYNWHSFEINFDIRTRILKNLGILLPLGYIAPLRATGLLSNPTISLGSTN